MEDEIESLLILAVMAIDIICPLGTELVMNLFERPEVLSIFGRTYNIEVD